MTSTGNKTSAASAVPGVRWGVGYAGIKQRPDDQSATDVCDVALMEMAQGSTIAAVFTQNAFCAAPVKIAQQRLQSEHLQIRTASKAYCLINSGNANAGTGAAGYAAAEASCEAVANALGVAADSVLPFSTGVIGQLLPVDKIANIAHSLADDLSADNWAPAARAIMTTDTVPKCFSRSVELAGKSVVISGICKGAGMIKPNMATMLAYVATDAQIASDDLESLLAGAVNLSFNRITVDGDTSTNDACLIAATGCAEIQVAPGLPGWDEFASALNALFIDMATAIIRDAEGASKFITISVRGGASAQECLDVGYTVAESPLVKTAFFASDANWGRILAAIGRSGVQNLDVEAVEIYLGEVLICHDGGTATDYQEDRAMEVMRQPEIEVTIDLHRGASTETIWTSDLSHDYVRINAEYRT